MRTTQRYRDSYQSECLTCHKIKPNTEMIAGGKDGRCKACRRNSNRFRGIDRIDPTFTWQRYQDLLRVQGGVCAICQAPPTYERLLVDHDHQTNRVRGLVCRSCNLKIGVIEKHPQLLERVIFYLTERALEIAS